MIYKQMRLYTQSKGYARVYKKTRAYRRANCASTRTRNWCVFNKQKKWPVHKSETQRVKQKRGDTVCSRKNRKKSVGTLVASTSPRGKGGGGYGGVMGGVMGG